MLKDFVSPPSLSPIALYSHASVMRKSSSSNVSEAWNGVLSHELRQELGMLSKSIVRYLCVVLCRVVRLLAVLCCAALCCAVLCCAVLCCAVLCCAVLC